MPQFAALLDSNVLIASLAAAHEHHEPSLRILLGAGPAKFAIAAHSYAEAYSTLTRKGDRAPFQFTPQQAWAALESVRAVTALVGLTAGQTIEAIKIFAQGNGTGARLYDRLIGQAALAHAIPRIITWNTSHMRGLFPSLQITTPAEFSRPV
jgi:predicted nucleic acid-binding protein